jgi:ribosomal protein S18 acetylase RimI-like enzyme
LNIRPAQIADVDPAAEMLYLSMRWEGDYMFGCDPRHPALKIVAGMFLSPGGRFSHKYAFVAEQKGQLVGLLAAYPAEMVPRLDLATGRYLITQFSLAALIRLVRHALAIAGQEAGRGEYYISNLAVLPPFQGRGIGSHLLAFAEQQAAAAGISRVSLCVDMDNPGAFRLYQRIGYRVVLTHTFKRRLVPQASQGYWRMVKPLFPVSI